MITITTTSAGQQSTQTKNKVRCSVLQIAEGGVALQDLLLYIYPLLTYKRTTKQIIAEVVKLHNERLVTVSRYD